MVYNLGSRQLKNHGRVILTFSQEERDVISRLADDLNLPSGQIVGTIVRKTLGFNHSKPLMKLIDEYRKKG